MLSRPSCSTLAKFRTPFAFIPLLAVFVGAPAWAQTATAGQIIISEFRVRGPSGANDEFIELYNASGAAHTVTAASGTGYGVAASDGTTRCTIPNGTVMPIGGHYLCVNSGAYSLGSYPAGNGTTATGDATYATDIADNAGIAVFNNNTGGGSYSVANRLDAVGSTSEANTTYKEGTGYPALTPFSIDYSFYRDQCGKGGSITTLGTCSSLTPKDTNNNAADFVFVDTNGTSAGAGQRLGAPGPQNLSSPISGSSSIAISLLDASVSASAAPNYVRDFTSDPANNSTFGTNSIRRRVTNNTGAPLTRLRYRIVDLTTFPAPSGFADWRPRTSVAVVVAGINDATTCASIGAPATTPCTVTVQGSTLEQPPSQPNGSGFDGSMSSGTITLGTPLANGASVAVQFLLGIQQTGTSKLGLLVETLPGGGGSMYFECGTDGCSAPSVSSIVRADANPTVAAALHYTVTFSASVTGVNAADFSLTTTGVVSGASVTGVSGSGATYTVTVNRGTGNGTIRLNVVDDDSITATVGGLALGGAGAGNGDYNAGESYTINVPAPSVICGDLSTLGSTEECDDGNAINGDGCDSNCTISRCNNGVKDSDEACDDGNAVNGDGCDTNCMVSACGNYAVSPTEQCDDGNLVNGDGCDSNCKRTGCGNGIVTAGEECDDGNTATGDGCSTTCTIQVALPRHQSEEPVENPFAEESSSCNATGAQGSLLALLCVGWLLRRRRR